MLFNLNILAVWFVTPAFFFAGLALVGIPILIHILNRRRYKTVNWAAMEFFGAHSLLATVRAEHQAFYKRLLGHHAVCAPRAYPNLQKPISLMTLDYQDARERVQARHPFFRSTYFERRMLFERHHAVQQRSAA